VYLYMYITIKSIIFKATFEERVPL